MQLPESTVLILTLVLESSVCSVPEMQAVARTIQVRAEDRKTSFRKECLRPNQYSCWGGYTRKRKILKAYNAGTYHGSPAWKRAKQVVDDLYAGNLNSLPRWDHYYNPSLSRPLWTKRLKDSRKMKYHIFGRLG